MRRIAGIAVLAGVCVAATMFAGVVVAGEQDASGAAPLPKMEEVLTMRVEGDIAVDATGKVIGYTLGTKLDGKLQSLIDQAVPHWVFFPPMVEGKPSAAKSHMRITLLGKKIPEGYDVRIENVLFADTDTRDWDVPKEEKKAANTAETDGATLSIASATPRVRYPKYYVNGIVTIMLNIAPDGRVLDATPTQCSLYFAGGSSTQLARACREMEQSAANAIKQWRVAIDTHGKPLEDKPLSATLPLAYKMRGRSAQAVAESSEPGQWRMESRTPYRTPDWLPDRRFAQRVGTSDAVGGELVPSDATLQLRDGQLGVAL